MNFAKGPKVASEVSSPSGARDHFVQICVEMPFGKRMCNGRRSNWTFFYMNKIIHQILFSSFKVSIRGSAQKKKKACTCQLSIFSIGSEAR